MAEKINAEGLRVKEKYTPEEYNEFGNADDPKLPAATYLCLEHCKRLGIRARM